MRFKYYLRGAGIGVIVATLILSITFLFYDNISDEEVIRRALKLGMVMEENKPGTLSDITQPEASKADLETATDGETNADGDPLAGAGGPDDPSGDAGTNANQPGTSDENAGQDSAHGTGGDAGSQPGNNTDGNAGSQPGNNADGNAGSQPGNKSGEDGGQDSGQGTDGDAGAQGNADGNAGSPSGNKAGNNKGSNASKPSGSKPDDNTHKPSGQQPSADSGKTDKPQTEKVQVVIESGDVSRMVSAKVFEAGLVDDADEFNAYLGANDYDNMLQPGTYEIRKGSTFRQIARILTRQ